MKKRKDYSERTDFEKIQSNWTKINGLYDRKEWSSVVLRATTAVELSANFSIRQELEIKRMLDPDFVNHLLLWANGIQGKFDKLLIPIFKGTDHQKVLKSLKKKVQDINKERNSVAHSGQFKKESTAKRIIEECKMVIVTLVRQHDQNFTLQENHGKG